MASAVQLTIQNRANEGLCILIDSCLAAALIEDSINFEQTLGAVLLVIDGQVAVQAHVHTTGTQVTSGTRRPDPTVDHEQCQHKS